MEREKAKVKAQESVSAHPADTNGLRTPLRSSASSQHADGPVARSSSSTTSKSHVNGSRPHAATHPSPDDTESLARDMRTTGGSASYHASTSSSASSAPTTGLSTSAAMTKSHAQLTPPTTLASPSSSLSAAAAPATAQPTASHRADRTDRLLPIPNGSVRGPAAVERVPARDPSRSVKCVKRTYDPLVDASLSSSEKKKAKPIYKEFGLVCAPDNLTLRGDVILNRDSLG
jgi:histone-lysine N-methyltransferase SETD1